jgi:multidrug efflux pump
VKTLIEGALGRTRTVLMVLALLVVAGFTTYMSIPKEAEPDVQIPIVYVTVPYEGISAFDAERLLARPVETELQGLEGVKEIKSISTQGRATITIEFDTGVDIDQAVIDVRDKVDRAKAEFPAGTDEPSVEEVNLALFPVLVVTLSGDVPERALLRIALDLQDRIEAVRTCSRSRSPASATSCSRCSSTRSRSRATASSSLTWCAPSTATTRSSLPVPSMPAAAASTSRFQASSKPSRTS